MASPLLSHGTRGLATICLVDECPRRQGPLAKSKPPDASISTSPARQRPSKMPPRTVGQGGHVLECPGPGLEDVRARPNPERTASLCSLRLISLIP
jgi:hypothetical protein